MKISQDKLGNYYGPILVSPKGRLIYTSLVTPDKYGKYAASILIEKNESNLEEMKSVLDVCNGLLLAKYEAKDKIPSVMPTMPVHDGDVPNAEGKLREVEKNQWRIKFTHKTPITQEQCKDKDLQPLNPASLVDGVLVRVEMQPMFFKMSAANFGITWKLKTIQMIVDDGVRFASSAPQGSLLTPIVDEPAAGLASGAAVENASGLRL